MLSCFINNSSHLRRSAKKFRFWSSQGRQPLLGFSFGRRLVLDESQMLNDIDEQGHLTVEETFSVLKESFRTRVVWEYYKEILEEPFPYI